MRPLDIEHPALSFDEDRYGAAAQRMVHRQLRSRGIADPRTLAAMRAVPRHRFVAEHLRPEAYDDRALPTLSGQTISQPYIVALMTELLDARPDHLVLEVGAGSGYQAAVLSLLARTVITIERYGDLAAGAEAALRDLGIANVQLIVGDGTLGLPDRAPFHRILVAAAAPRAPQPLLDQLADPGRLVIPIGPRDSQALRVFDKHDGVITQRDSIPCRFVPLIGEHAWRK